MCQGCIYPDMVDVYVCKHSCAMDCISVYKNCNYILCLPFKEIALVCTEMLVVFN